MILKSTHLFHRCLDPKIHAVAFRILCCELVFQLVFAPLTFPDTVSHTPVINNYVVSLSLPSTMIASLNVNLM